VPTRSQSDGPHEVVDLAVPFSIDDTTCFSLRTASRRPRETAPFVPMLDGLNVAEIPRESVELRSGCAHDGTSSLVALSARMIRSTMP
jgi:hypothetical protein